MKKIKLILLPLLTIAILSGCSMYNTNQSQFKNESSNNQSQQTSQCEKAGGTIVLTEECDGSKIEWCKISEKEQCYSDQIKNNRCSVGKYDEESGSIAGIMPRVLCDGQKNGQ
jgi:putative hemolysin